MTGKKVLIGITGGIAAYKTLDLIRLLVKAGAEVRAVLTANATRFVTPLSVETLSGNPAFVEQFGPRNHAAIEHIELSLWPDILVVAPATANFLAKAANGIADDLLTTTFSALRTDIPLVLAPAMNTRMWDNPATARNFSTLSADFGDRLQRVGPVEKLLACGEEGMGAMAEIEDIFEAVAACVRVCSPHRRPGADV